VKELANAVTQTPGFETWNPDFTPASLGRLGEWFVGQVEIRSRTQDELQAIYDRLVFPMDIPNEELTNRTFSLAMDIGMYFSQVLIKNHPSLTWVQPLESKRFADYGQPSLAGFGSLTLNPVRIAVTLAYGLARKSKTGKRLQEIYDYWAQRVQPIS
jgi:hypothetical protein